MYLGVDGGGSKTAFVIIDDNGKLRARYKSSGAYYLQIGMEGLSNLLREGVEQALLEAGIHKNSIKYAFFGLPAYGEDSRVQSALDVLPKSILGGVNYSCGNDMVCGWAGSLGCKDGINIVAGTGSIAYGEAGFQNARSGGWGELFSDEGSAYWLAVKGLNIFSKMSDGRLPRGSLYDIFREAFKIEADLDLSGIIMSEIAPSRDKVAALAKYVAKAASMGDEAALQVFQNAAAELSEIIVNIADKLPFHPEEPIKVSYSGGVFAAGKMLIGPLESQLANQKVKFDLTRPIYEPDIGAALYAAKLFGITLIPQR